MGGELGKNEKHVILNNVDIYIFYKTDLKYPSPNSGADTYPSRPSNKKQLHHMNLHAMGSCSMCRVGWGRWRMMLLGRCNDGGTAMVVHAKV